MPLSNLKATTVIQHLKSVFSHHGTPECTYSDNGTQWERVDTSEFCAFANEWGFQHQTSSPRFPQSNGFVEAAVKIIKRSLVKDDEA